MDNKWMRAFQVGRARDRGKVGTWVGLRWWHASGHPASENEKGLAGALRGQTLLQYGTIQGCGRKRRKGISLREG